MIKILLVEDDKVVRNGLCTGVNWNDHNMEVVFAAPDAPTALEYLEANSVDLVLSDISMPYMSGLDFMEKAVECYPGLFFVILTVSDDFEHVQRTLRQGAIDYIAKFEFVGENIDAILNRICKRILNENTKRSISMLNSQFSQVDNVREGQTGGLEKFKKLAKRWMELKWVSSQSIFTSLLEELQNINTPIQTIIDFVYDLYNEVSSVFDIPMSEIKSSIREIRQWKDIERILAALRLAACENIIHQSYSKDIIRSIVEAKMIIAHELSSSLHAKDIAERLFMSKSYFDKCFKDITGQSFNDYLRNKRIQQAQILLRKTTLSITEVANRVGYNDERYFSKVFSEVTKILPSQYRSGNR